MTGSGSVGILWSNDAVFGRGTVHFYLDVAGGQKAGLLTSVDNGGGLRTDITYGTDGRVSAVTLAEPTPGAPRPGHTYAYSAATGGGSEAVVHANGLTEPNGAFMRYDWSTDPMPIPSTSRSCHAWRGPRRSAFSRARR